MVGDPGVDQHDDLWPGPDGDGLEDASVQTRDWGERLLRAADRHRPDPSLFLTNLQGPADWRPAWPVIWRMPLACQDAEAPFGRKLVLG